MLVQAGEYTTWLICTSVALHWLNTSLTMLQNTVCSALTGVRAAPLADRKFCSHPRRLLEWRHWRNLTYIQYSIFRSTLNLTERSHCQQIVSLFWPLRGGRIRPHTVHVCVGDVSVRYSQGPCCVHGVLELPGPSRSAWWSNYICCKPGNEC